MRKSMTDLTKLYEQLDNRTDEGKRFYKEVIVDEEYKEAKDKTGVIIDLGANLGDFSYYMYDNASVIYAIEAHEANFDILLGYVQEHGLTKIHPYHLAIAGDNGLKEVYEHGGCGGYAIWGDSGQKVGEVQGKTLNTFLEENNITHVDVLKIDVEGAEDEIFKGEDFKDAATKIDFIIGENHGKAIQETLEKQGYIFHQEDVTFTARKEHYATA
jgi:FkbM family methyltransferase